MSWGSCQYDEAERVYDQFMSAELDINLYVKSGGKQESIELDTLRKVLINNINEGWDEPEEAEYRKQVTDEINEATKPGEFLDICSNLSWDLWSAASFVAQFFVDYEIKDKPDVEVAGPIFNMLAQSENPETAIACYLLALHYGTGVEHFCGFDT